MAARKLPEFLTEREVDALLRATRTQRDRLILFLMRFVGLRVSEISKLRVEHIDFAGPTLMVREGKGKKDRALPLPKAVAGPLRGWIAARTEGPVFPSRRGGALKPRALQLLLKRLAVAAQLRAATERRRVTPHKLRHAFCSAKIAAGVDVAVVRDLMGHSSIAVTDVYSHATPERLRKAMEV